MKYKIDVARIRENSIVLNGWVIGSSPEAEVLFTVQDENQKNVEFKYVPVRRDDVSQNYFKTVYEKDFGFDIRIPYVRDDNEDRFPAGMAPVLIGMCFLGSVQIFFIGLMGEYILSINARVMKRPLVIEEERLNFAVGNAAEKEEDGLENCEDADLFAASLEDGENV